MNIIVHKYNVNIVIDDVVVNCHVNKKARVVKKHHAKKANFSAMNSIYSCTYEKA